VGTLPSLELPAGARPDEEAGGPAPGNEQTPEAFAAEAERIADLATPVRWIQPSRHEHGEAEERPRQPASEDLVQVPTTIKGSAARGTVLHKLMEEILTGELQEDTAAALTARAATLIEQLGITPTTDASAGPCPSEMAGTVQRTLALPEIRELRPRLVAEVSVLAPGADVEGRASAVAGFADAITVDDDERLDVVIDWKSDVAPDERTRGLYRDQVAQYVRALGAQRGAVVYMTPGLVDQVEAAA
jgi:ATP-dependent exoDNAse (exonuclease V) beta subunit